MKKSFTMIELVFIIVILGILAAVAIPKLAGTREDAETAKMAMNVETAIADIANYALAQAKTETNLSKMSNIIKNWELNGIADNSDDNKSKIKIGDDDDCLIIEIKTDGRGDKNLTVITKENPSSKRCQNIKRAVEKQHYSVKIEGYSINI